MAEISRGLAGVLADTSQVSAIDGEEGTLRYRGYSIEDLVAHTGFAEVVGLVLDGEIPDEAGRQDVERALRSRSLPAPIAALLDLLPRDTHPMTVLQVVMPLLDDAERKQQRRERNREAQRGYLLDQCARIPTLVAAWSRVKQGKVPIAPDPTLPIHADFLRMIHGQRPEAREVEILDITQILQMEHGFNASTFAGRTAASTLAPLSEVLSACVGTLHGPLHGGADEAAYRMALEIGSPENAAAFVDAALEKREKIMGLGHRAYRVVDPRAKVLKGLAQELADLKGIGDVVRTLTAVDDHAAKRFEEKGKRIRANVEFYKGAVFAALGLTPDLFTCLFVMARIYGWGAHVLELWDDPRLYRPKALYDGPGPRSVSR